MVEHFPNLGREVFIQIQKVKKTSNRLNPNRATSRHIKIKLPNGKEKEFQTQQKNIEKLHVKELVKAIGRFLNRNFLGQNRMTYSKYWGGGRERLWTKNTIPSENILQKWRQNEDFPEQTKAEGTHYQYTCLTKMLREVFWITIKGHWLNHKNIRQFETQW